jgi:phosphatidylglycerol:prolipoprotein diacylglycerol transferase
MLTFPDIDPVAVRIGPLAVHWYGLAYVVGIGLGWWLLHRRAARGDAGGWTVDEVSDLVFYSALGAVLGGRVGYVLFYNLGAVLANPLEAFAVWHGGMSFHGGVLGFITAMGWYAQRRGHAFFEATDFVVPVVPLGLLMGRIANFVNQELWGAPTSLPWGVVFTNPAAGGMPRHPSQLYEAALEGLVLFVVLNVLRAKRPPRAVVSATFLIGYGLARFAVEFIREPDAPIGYLAWGWLTMGQVLSAPMIIAGLAILVFGLKHGASAREVRT